MRQMDAPESAGGTGLGPLPLCRRLRTRGRSIWPRASKNPRRPCHKKKKNCTSQRYCGGVDSFFLQPMPPLALRSATREKLIRKKTKASSLPPQPIKFFLRQNRCQATWAQPRGFQNYRIAKKKTKTN
ncbi:hypothetical protein TW95_gp1363 [Pandoravirus inopinatum]|uniref:Uncharacterized protein n=1 Tax=Pandoravirus inopinatum TaxID=1605721 RepID=A0A0B5JE99_9VIRU|nr:hypothetical protein TW95_gp1363 [Pandoravirus inopinatum]AJF98097.1 hypothetical protein [Pandoravirus inopinatum]